MHIPCQRKGRFSAGGFTKLAQNRAAMRQMVAPASDSGRRRGKVVVVGDKAAVDEQLKTLGNFVVTDK